MKKKKTPPAIHAGKSPRLMRKLMKILIPFAFFTVFVAWIVLPLGYSVLWSLVDPQKGWAYPNPLPEGLSLFTWKYIIENAKKAGIEAGMCGEAAGNPCMIPLLLSFGLDEFSVSPSNVLETRKNIASWSIREADEVTTSVMAMCTEKEVANYLSDYIAAKEQRSGFASQTRRI